MKKIIIFGFPHCGTTILRCILGHIKDIYEIIDETHIIDETIIDDELSNNCNYILCKFPFTYDEFLTNAIYDDYIKIFIIRNPLYVFSSLNERFDYNIPNDHSIDDYIKCIRQFEKSYNSKLSTNLYTIKYEDLFDKYCQDKRLLFY